MAVAKPLGLVVLGARGRLGALVVTEAMRRPLDLTVRAALGRGDPLDFAGAQAVIDVTTAGNTTVHARACAAQGVALVVATTGMTREDELALDEAARRIPVLVAANLSLSAHVTASLARAAAAQLSADHAQGFDIEVVEVHHKHKQDAPSGTALMLAAAAAAGRAQDGSAPGAVRRGRDGRAPRLDGEIGVSAVRGGDVVGEHTVLFLGEGERLELVHRITDRSVFARGALAAAQFLTGGPGAGPMPPGRYSMADVLER